MAQKPFLVISDLHLGAVPVATEYRFKAFLNRVASEATGLLINGDLFEFGIAYQSAVPRNHIRFLAQLADVVESGLPVYFVAGNHDYLEWGGHVLREDVGVTLLPDPVVMQLAGQRALITHGDAVGAGAFRSRWERRLSRSRGVAGLLRCVHPDLAARLQPITTTTRRQVQLHKSGQGRGPKARAPVIEEWARSVLYDDPSLDAVIAGHAHLPTRIEVAPGRYYLNAGDWITHFSYLRLLDNVPPEVRSYEGVGQTL